MPKKEVESWTRGTTLKLSFAAKVLNIKQSNLDRLVKQEKVRKVIVPFEKFQRVPVIDCIQVLKKEREALITRKDEVEKYLAHLSEVFFIQQQMEDKRVQNVDAQTIIEKLAKL